MIFQQPTSSLNPVWDVGSQIEEVLRIHRGLNGKAARSRAADMLRMVGIPDPERRLKAYPHEMSGGMAQRVMIAMALACEPELLIADEPTTALDVTIQAQILDLMRHLRDELGTAIVLITHDLGVVAEMCDRVAVMYAGEIVEETDVTSLFRDPKHPYTRGLIGSIPVVGAAVRRARRHPGQRPEPHRPAGRLPVRAALPGSRRGQPHDRRGAPPRPAARVARPRRALLALPRRVRRAHPRGAAGARGPQVRRMSAAEAPVAAGPAGGAAPAPRGGPGHRSSRSSTSSSTSRSRPGSSSARAPGSGPSTTSASRSARARRSAWWASPAAARRPSAG